jgi:hypothetical protein
LAASCCPNSCTCSLSCTSNNSGVDWSKEEGSDCIPGSKHVIKAKRPVLWYSPDTGTHTGTGGRKAAAASAARRCSDARQTPVSYLLAVAC